MEENFKTTNGLMNGSLESYKEASHFDMLCNCYEELQGDQFVPHIILWTSPCIETFLFLNSIYCDETLTHLREYYW